MRDIEQVVDELRLSPDVALERVQRAALRLGRQHIGAQHMGPAEHRIERRAQLVRQRRDEFILGAVRFLRLLVETGVVERQRRPCRDAAGQLLMFRQEHAGPRVPEADAAADVPGP